MALHDLVIGEDIERLLEYIKYEVDAQVKAEALSVAVQVGNLQAAQALLDNQADPYLKHKGKTALYWAAISDDVEFLTLLTHSKYVDIYNSHREMTPVLENKQRMRAVKRERVLNEVLLEAASLGKASCVEYLLQAGAKSDEYGYHDDEHLSWCTPLIAACYGPIYYKADKKLCHKTVEVLLQNGADAHMANSTGVTALHWAACADMEDTIRTLTSRGCSVHCKNTDGDTPLVMAVGDGCCTTSVLGIKCLMEFGAEVEYVDESNRPKSALVKAVSSCHNLAVDLFLQAGADPDFEAYTNEYRRARQLNLQWRICPIAQAIHNRNLTAMKLLIQHNCNINSGVASLYPTRMTPFELAASTMLSVLMCHILALAGCSHLILVPFVPKCDLYRHMMNVQESHRYAHLWQEVMQLASSPFTLRQLCRLTIRDRLGRKIRRTAELPLPRKLQDYLMFKDLDSLSYLQEEGLESEAANISQMYFN